VHGPPKTSKVFAASASGPVTGDEADCFLIMEHQKAIKEHQSEHLEEPRRSWKNPEARRDRRKPKKPKENQKKTKMSAVLAVSHQIRLHACGANYPSQKRAISPAARTTFHQGGSNFACGANYPHQAPKGGYFVTQIQLNCGL
jgi:hypothetical protein